MTARSVKQSGDHEGPFRLADSLPEHVENRVAFVGLVPPDAEALEIGPMNAPLLRGEHVRYFDILDHDALTAEAVRLDRGVGEVPIIHYVSATGDLSIVDRTFDVVLSSHSIEHQPDFLRHLNTVAKLLRPGGLYFVLCPDRRYCFDHFIEPSTLADVLDAYYGGRVAHSLKSLITQVALTTHNESRRHWRGDHGQPRMNLDEIKAWLETYRASPDGFVDVHAWRFEPETFHTLIGLLVDLEHSALRVRKIYPTLKNQSEFWAVLERVDDAAANAAFARDAQPSVTQTPRNPAPRLAEGVVSSPTPPEAWELARRRLGKLRKDPRGFLADSRFGVARRIARYLPIR